VSKQGIKRMKYKKDFLDKVIVRIDFDTPLPITANGPAKSIYNVVKKRFPITEEKTIMGKELLIGPNITQEQPIEKKEWNYYGEKREKQLTISLETMFIKYNKYEYYEMLREDFLSVLGALLTAYPKLQIKRLGLRYIDNIKIPNENPLEWDRYLKPALTGIFAIAETKETISRAFHVLELNNGEDSLRFQFGMFNPDYPAPIKKKAYILDHDIYVSKIIDSSEIVETLDRFHATISHSFEEVITDDLRKLMGPINER